MAERGDAGSGPDVPDREGVRKLPGVWQKFVDKGGAICYDTIRVQETAPSYGEMSEWLKEPVLKTGGAQVPVGSNPTLSANFSNVNPDLRKYPSGRRGSPAKGVGWIKPARGFKSLLPRQATKPLVSGQSLLYQGFCCNFEWFISLEMAISFKIWKHSPDTVKAPPPSSYQPPQSRPCRRACRCP